MKIHWEHNGEVFEYETRPMRSSRFRAVCALIAGALYVGLVWVVASLCGFLGVLALLAVSVLAALIVAAAAAGDF